MSNQTIQVRKKGNLTLPVELRNKYGVDAGDVYTVIDLGEGTILLSPRVSMVDRLADQTVRILRESNVSLEDLLKTLDEERQVYYREHYARE